MERHGEIVNFTVRYQVHVGVVSLGFNYQIMLHCLSVSPSPFFCFVVVVIVVVCFFEPVSVFQTSWKLRARSAKKYYITVYFVTITES